MRLWLVALLLVFIISLGLPRASTTASTPAPSQSAPPNPTNPGPNGAKKSHNSKELSAPDIDLLQASVFLSWAVYQDGWDTQKGWFKFAADNLVVTHEIDDSGKNTKGAVVVDFGRNTTFIVFRGTQKTSLDNWVTNLDSDQDSYSVPARRTVYVQQGFNEAVASSDVLPKVRTAVSEARAANRSIVFTGHSLGAALASVALFRTELDRPVSQQFGPQSPTLITFGSPRAGDRQWSRVFRDVPGWRNVNGKDPIPQHPRRSEGDHGYRQVALEELWTSRGKLKFCNNDEDDKCSHGQDFIAGAPGDHAQYLGFPSINKGMLGPWVTDLVFTGDGDCPGGFYRHPTDIFANDLDSEHLCIKTTANQPPQGISKAYMIKRGRCNGTDEVRDLDHDVGFRLCLRMSAQPESIWATATLIQGKRFVPCPLVEFGWRRVNFDMNTEASDSPTFLVFNRLNRTSALDDDDEANASCVPESLPRDWTLIVILISVGVSLLLLCIFRHKIADLWFKCRFVCLSNVEKKLKHSKDASSTAQVDIEQTAIDHNSQPLEFKSGHALQQTPTEAGRPIELNRR